MSKRTTAVARRKRIPRAQLETDAVRHVFASIAGVVIAVFCCYQLWRFAFGHRFEAALVVTLFATGIGVLLLPKAAGWALHRRHFRLALLFSPSPARRRWVRFQIGVATDDTERAMALVTQLPHTPSVDVLAWNSMVNLLIATGRYHQAVRFRRHFGQRLRDARELLPQHYGLVLSNLAEAQYNLGHWRRGEQLMRALQASGKMTHPLNHSAGYEQLAWIEARAGNVKAAFDLLAQCKESALPVNYRAELHFTFAAAHLANHDLPQARRALEAARARLIRPSSARNLLFLEARCAFVGGDFKLAASLCERAATHAFRGQGGDGLLLWGDACDMLGDSAGAARAWQLAIERDGESESAMLARQRVQSDPGETAGVSGSRSSSPGPHPPFGHPPPTGEGSGFGA